MIGLAHRISSFLSSPIFLPLVWSFFFSKYPSASPVPPFLRLKTFPYASLILAVPLPRRCFFPSDELCFQGRFPRFPFLLGMGLSVPSLPVVFKATGSFFARLFPLLETPAGAPLSRESVDVVAFLAVELFSGRRSPERLVGISVCRFPFPR